MWLTEKMVEPRTTGEVFSGKVTGAQNAQVAVQGENEYRELALAAPWGIAYLPPAGARAVILGGGQQSVCAGTIVEAGELEPGELLLYSAGGARICLKNSGDVIINGQTFAKVEEP